MRIVARCSSVLLFVLAFLGASLWIAGCSGPAGRRLRRLRNEQAFVSTIHNVGRAPSHMTNRFRGVLAVLT
jgi:hypothetical protein